MSLREVSEGGRTYHVGWREIAHDELVLGFAHDSSDLFSNAVHAHLRLKVVRRNLGRVDQVPLFVLELLLDAAVEEKGHVSVFLRLCFFFFSCSWWSVY